jgi:hypothetical protein
VAPSAGGHETGWWDALGTLCESSSEEAQVEREEEDAADAATWAVDE